MAIQTVWYFLGACYVLLFWLAFTWCIDSHNHRHRVECQFQYTNTATNDWNRQSNKGFYNRSRNSAATRQAYRFEVFPKFNSWRFSCWKSADSKSGDYTDVVVKTPYGEIPWNDLSRISDAEMKILMIDIVNHTYHFIQEFFDDERGGRLLLKIAEKDPAPNWDDPT